MSRVAFFLRAALNSLRRGQGRVLAALACITFGVMSLVAMLIVARALARAAVLEPSHIFGADLSLSPRDTDYVQPEQEAALRALQAEGVLSRYMLVAETASLFFQRPGMGEVHFAQSGLGIDPALYPLAGDFALAEPGQTLPALLQSPGDVVITRDLADEYGLAVGDTLLLSDLRVGAPVRAVIRGIAIDTPNHQGGKVYYTYATAEQLAGRQPAANLALATSTDPAAAAVRLIDHWYAFPAEQLAVVNDAGYDLIDLLFKGAGLMGLMVGGIGIANTMQVLLRSREREVAVWKTLGYTARDLYALFALEAGLLGLVGSLLGAGLGVLVSARLLDLIMATGNMLLRWSWSPDVVAAGALAGLATTLIFALWAIVRAAQVPPQVLLRRQLGVPGRAAWLPALGLAVALAVPFTLLAGLIMGSLLEGVGVLLFTLAGLVGLGGLLGGLAWLAARLLRLPGVPLARLAQSSLRRRGLSLVFALIALYTGLTALAFGVVMTQNAQREMSEREPAAGGRDFAVAVIAPAKHEAAILEALAAHGLANYGLAYSAAVEAVQVEGQSGDYDTRLTGLTRPYEHALQGAPWGSVPDGVYVHEFSGIAPGDRLTLTLAGGATRTLEVVGTYSLDFTASLQPVFGLVLPADLSLSLAPPQGLIVYVEAPASEAARLSRALGQALPQATVINRPAFLGRFVQAYRNLFVLAVAMASLALLAGVLLVANSVSLAMLDRRYEIGVLKAVGYTRAHVLATLALEYAPLAVIATGAALATVQVFLWMAGAANPLAASLLVLDPAWAAGVAVTGLGLVLLTVLAATWAPTGTSPAVVLNDRE